MAEKTTFIKIDRNILDWGWYKDANTFRVFMHLLLTANIKAHKFMGVEIRRGELATSQKSLAESLGISVQSVRTAISHLKSTGEVTVSQHSRFSVISIVNYDLYQGNQQAKRQSANSQLTGNQQQSKNVIKKEYPNGYIYPSRADLRSYVEEEGLSADPDEIFDYYEAVGWEINGKAIKDWRAVCRRWKSYEKPKAEQSQEDQDAELHRLLDIMEKGGNIYDTTGS